MLGVKSPIRALYALYARGRLRVLRMVQASSLHVHVGVYTLAGELVYQNHCEA